MGFVGGGEVEENSFIALLGRGDTVRCPQNCVSLPLDVSCQLFPFLEFSFFVQQPANSFCLARFTQAPLLLKCSPEHPKQLTILLGVLCIFHMVLSWHLIPKVLLFPFVYSFFLTKPWVSSQGHEPHFIYISNVQQFLANDGCLINTWQINGQIDE